MCPSRATPAIEHLLIDAASEEELDEWIRLERFGHHPWFLQLLGQLQRCASVPFRCREVAPEQPGVPEVLLDQCPQREIVPRLAPSGLEHGPGAPPPFGLGEAHPQIQQHAGPSWPGDREVHRLLQDAPRQRRCPRISKCATPAWWVRRTRSSPRSRGVARRAISQSSAADCGAPREEASRAASSRAAATATSGPSTDRARWRARSSGSRTIVASRACSSRRRASEIF